VKREKTERNAPGVVSPGVNPGIARRSLFFCFCGGLQLHARRSEGTAAIEETLRHSGLDPESSSSIKFSGASRRRKRFWIPDQVRNDEVLGCSPGVGFGIARRNSRAQRAVALWGGAE
jgi:hypothetical protein